jgi:hypothetical protein
MDEALSKRIEDLREWFLSVSGPEWKLVAKILSGNDTLATAAHQAGPYIPKGIVFDLFPEILKSRELNPRKTFSASIDSHGAANSPTVIWYNNAVVGSGTRDEARITGWGGSRSPLLDPDATGSVVVFAFRSERNRDAEECRIWLCSTPDEEEVVFDQIGPIEPGRIEFVGESQQPIKRPTDRPCTLQPKEIDPNWLLRFPTTADVVAMTVSRLASARRQSPDDRLIARRDCEYELFRSIESAVVLPRIREGFGSVGIFVDYANSVTNRRKARSGASLGLQMCVVFGEEKLSFSYDDISEGRKRPDFLFPSSDAYASARDSSAVRMLAAKTTCKDRWRQILNEADKIPVKHLLTLQPGVSVHQYEEMKKAGVVLVVPRSLHAAYPPTVRSELLDLSRFVTETRARCQADA